MRWVMLGGWVLLVEVVGCVAGVVGGYDWGECSIFF